MKLNLGAGRLIFPLPEDLSHLPVHVRSHLSNMPETVRQQGWVNVDKYPNPGIAETVDLFRFPWIRSSNGSPWNDSSVDEIYAGHLIEHIPHRVTVADGTPAAMHKTYWQMCNEMDGWFVWFSEAWRILKPDGLLMLRFPNQMSSAAYVDPTHTRYLNPGVFGYFNPQEDDPFDYHLPCRFDLAEPIAARFTDWFAPLMSQFNEDQLTAAPYRIFDACNEWRVTLRAVKA